MAGDTFSGPVLRDIVRKRSDVLDSLAAGPADKPALVDRVGVSRSTVDRAVDSLVEAGLIRRRDGRYHVTEQGRLALTTYEEYVERTDALAAAGPVLAGLPGDVSVDRRLVETGTVRIAEPHAPESAITEAVRELEAAQELFVFSPVVKSNYVRPVYEEVAERGLEATLVLEGGATESLASLAEVTGVVESLLAADSFSLYRTERDLPFMLYLMRGAESDAVGITVHEDGGIVGSVTSRDPDAVAWGRELFDEVLEDTDPVPSASLL
ncbi:helix-turn-helix transcriptional regulator [Haloarcula litorea]|uniref:helix-turn-helix transcriptional regulator n=1 Tax=Haloarcula litorea TaxID=3032579 RepID=UPI0023E85216|nr:MarR family transcriptional regulator [Halomicroarcula sp. GDY20]